MKYDEAVAIKNASKHLIGTTDQQGYLICDVIIVPSDQDKRNDFLLCYIQNKDARYCLIDYLNDDLIVMGVDTTHLTTDGVLFYNVIQPELVYAG